MDLNFSVFQEPRGVMRILHLIFSISAFATICGFNGNVVFKCAFDKGEQQYIYTYEYPFNINLSQHDLNPVVNASCHTTVSTIGNFSSDAKFFVTTGVFAMLLAFGLIFVYIKLDHLYRTNNRVPLTDFILTVILAVLWLSSSAAWGNGLSGLKHVTDPSSFKWENITEECPITKCTVFTSSFSTLNISVVLGFLNFFLWTSDLWFVYKETVWFQGNQNQETFNSK